MATKGGSAISGDDTSDGLLGEQDGRGNDAGGRESRSGESGHNSWDFVKIIKLPSDVKAPRLFCSAGGNAVILGDTLRGAVFTVDLETGEVTKRTLVGEVMDCAFSTDGTLIASEYPSGGIGLYDRSGKRVTKIRLTGLKAPCNLSVAAGRDGAVVVGSVGAGSKTVYFIDPTTGELLKSGKIHGEEISGEIRVTTAGFVVVKAGEDELTVLDSETAKLRTSLKRPEWNEVRCAVDPHEDTLYVCYIRDVKASPAIALIDEIGIDGRVKKKEALEFKQVSRPTVAPLVTPSGQMVVCNGRELLIYKKVYFTKGIQPAKKWVKV